MQFLHKSVTDSLVGIYQKQKEVVLFNSGKTGLSSFRNYLTIATNEHKPQEVIMMANTETKMIEKEIPIIDDFISYDDFMAFTNFFVDELRIASHDTIFLQNDGRRRNIYYEANKLLNKKRDIINYLCLT